jgi:uncharacterized protein YbjQ (UPF0145 family)
MDTSATGLILATTAEIEGRQVREYLGIVSGEAAMSTPPVQDRLEGAGRRGRARSTNIEQQVCETRSQAVAAMVRAAEALGASAVIAVDIDYTNVRRPAGGELLVVTASGTAVIL